LIEKDYKYAYYFDGNGVQAPQSEFYDLRSQANGGTDTDEDNDLGGTTGKAVEYTNYSEWAENKRLVKKATPELRAKRTEMEAKLKLAIDTKLTPLSQRPAVPPEDFQVQHFEYMDSGTLQNKLQITWLSRSNTQYQLQESLDQTTWRVVKDSDGKDMAPILGNNGPVWVTHRVSEHKVFYRLAWFPKTEANAPEPSSVIA
jgi:hypothetical protein